MESVLDMSFGHRAVSKLAAGPEPGKEPKGPA